LHIKSSTAKKAKQIKGAVKICKRKEMTMAEKRIKLVNVDVLDTLQQIMKQNTVMYQEDFISDKDFIRKAVENSTSADDSLLWMCRTHGTYCFWEGEVYLKGTFPYHTWRYYAETKASGILAYALCNLRMNGDEVFGDIYELDYHESWEMVNANSCVPGFCRVCYENGSIDIPYGDKFEKNDDKQLGKYLSHRIFPQDKESWAYALWKSAKCREKNRPCDVKEYIDQLRKARIYKEAARIVNDVSSCKSLKEFSSKEYEIHLSYDFTALSTVKELRYLMLVLPYDSVRLGDSPASDGFTLLIRKSEAHKRRLRKGTFVFSDRLDDGFEDIFLHKS